MRAECALFVACDCRETPGMGTRLCVQTGTLPISCSRGNEDMEIGLCARTGRSLLPVPGEIVKGRSSLSCSGWQLYGLAWQSECRICILC